MCILQTQRRVQLYRLGNTLHTRITCSIGKHYICEHQLFYLATLCFAQISQLCVGNTRYVAVKPVCITCNKNTATFITLPPGHLSQHPHKHLSFVRTTIMQYWKHETVELMQLLQKYCITSVNIFLASQGIISVSCAF